MPFVEITRAHHHLSRWNTIQTMIDASLEREHLPPLACDRWIHTRRGLRFSGTSRECEALVHALEQLGFRPVGDAGHAFGFGGRAGYVTARR